MRLGFVAERLQRQHRPEHLALHDLGVVRARLDQRRLVLEPAELGHVAAAHDRGRRARGRAPRSPATRCELLGWISGPDGVASSRGSPSTCSSVNRWNRSMKASRTDSSTSMRVPARHTWPASSNWPAAFVAAASRSASANTISGPLPPSSAVNGTMLRAAAPPIGAGLGRAGEAHAPHAGVGHERRAGLLADALHDVEDAGRQAGLDREVGEQRARQRRPLGRLQHDRGARRQRRRGLPRREHERRVPRRDHGGRAAGMRSTRLRGAVRLPDPLLVRRGQVGVPAEVAGAAADHARPQRAPRAWPCRGTRRSRPGRIRIDQIREPVQVGRPRPAGPDRRPLPGTRLGRQRGRPGRPRAPGRGRPRRAARTSSVETTVLEASIKATPPASPPMKCSGETSTPATSTRALIPAARKRSSSTSTAA